MGRANARDDEEAVGTRDDQEGVRVRRDEEAAGVGKDQDAARAMDISTWRHDHQDQETKRWLALSPVTGKSHYNAYAHFDVAILDKKCKASLHHTLLHF